MEEEIDLRLYIKALLRNWKWIVGTVVLTALTAFSVSSFISPTYEAQAAVTVVRSRTSVSFASGIETLSDEIAGPGVDARRRALVALVTSNDIAVQVLDEIGTHLQSDERNVIDLLEMVKATNDGDLIFITAQYTNPDTAVLIADTWAQTYEQYANSLYGTDNGSNPAIVTSQVESTKAAYELAQAELEKFIGDNRIAILQGEIEAQQALFNTYQTARTASQTEPVTLRLNINRQLLADYYSDLREIERWLADARSLRDQVRADSSSSAADLGNVLALIALRGRAFGGSAPIQLQVDLTGGPIEGIQQVDVDTLIEILEDRYDATKIQIDTLNDVLVAEEPGELPVDGDHPLTMRIATLNDDILTLEAELAVQKTQERELTQARDLVWETYQTLTRKQAEMEIAAKTTGTEVKIASKSAVPKEPVNPRILLNTVLAGMVGMMLVVGGVFVIGWWYDEPRIQYQDIGSADDDLRDRSVVAESISLNLGSGDK